jgi:tyrosinase
MERYTTPEPFGVPVWEGQPSFYRADLQLHGVKHSGDSYEGRVFLGAADADPRTPLEAESGYAGSFYVFGHGPCYGDDGHCEVPAGPIHPFDYRRPHPLNRQTLAVTITDALRRLVEAGADRVEVTLVPTNVRDEDVGDVLHFEQLSLVTYD